MELSLSAKRIVSSLRQGRQARFPASELAPQRAIEILADLPASYRVEVRSREAMIVIEVGKGLVVGARAQRADSETVGQAAYAQLSTVGDAEVSIEPLRFPTLANILQPVRELPAVLLPHASERTNPDTVEVPLPLARPNHRFDPTEEIDVPPAMLTRGKRPAPPPRMPSEPPAALKRPPAAALVQTTESIASSAKRSVTRHIRGRRLPAAAAVALVVAGSAIVTAAAWSEEPEAVQAVPVASTATTIEEVGETEAPTADAPVEPPASSSERRSEASHLAREARRMLQEGQHREALSAARRAASMRSHLPYYQVLLGDALRANGNPRAARRAYRRALRMRPGYRPAVRRIRRG